MTKEIRKPPKLWLDLQFCEQIFNESRDLLIELFDEQIPPFETRYSGKLEGILNSVNQTYDSVHLNPTILDASSAYFYQLLVGHPFQNGNKRMGVIFTHSFLLLNDLTFILEPKDLFVLAIEVVDQSKVTKPENMKEAIKEVFAKGIGGK